MDLATTPTAEQDLQILPQMIAAWKEAKKESDVLKQQLREKVVKQRALEEVILRVMKKNQIGALDLKASNGRLSRRERKSKEALSQKFLTEMLAEHLKSEEAGKKAVEFLEQKRAVRTKDVLAFEDL